MNVDGLVAGAQGTQYNQDIQINVQKKAENVQAQQMQQLLGGMEQNMQQQEQAQQQAAEMTGVGSNLNLNA